VTKPVGTVLPASEYDSNLPSAHTCTPAAAVAWQRGASLQCHSLLKFSATARQRDVRVLAWQRQEERCGLGAQPGAAVAIVRLSGPEAVAVAQRVFRPSGRARGAASERWQPETHRVYHGRLVDAAGAVLDEARRSPDARGRSAPLAYVRMRVVPLLALLCLPSLLASMLGLPTKPEVSMPAGKRGSS